MEISKIYIGKKKIGLYLTVVLYGCVSSVASTTSSTMADTKSIFKKGSSSDKMGSSSEFNFKKEKLESSLKYKSKNGKSSGEVLSANISINFSCLNKKIQFYNEFEFASSDIAFGCSENGFGNLIVLTSTTTMRKGLYSLLDILAAQKRVLNIYGYEITQMISPFSFSDSSGYRFNLFSVKNVLRVLENFGINNDITQYVKDHFDFLNISVMKSRTYGLEVKKEGKFEECSVYIGRKDPCVFVLDIAKINYKIMNNCLNLNFILGFKHDRTVDNKIFAMKALIALFSLGYTHKRFSLNLNVLLKNASRDVTNSNFTDIYPATNQAGLSIPVKFDVTTNMLKGKKIAGDRFICGDLSFKIKADMYFKGIKAFILAYNLSLKVSINNCKFISFTVGLTNDRFIYCSDSARANLMYRVSYEDKNLNDVGASYKNYTNSWALIPYPIISIKINWLEI